VVIVIGGMLTPLRALEILYMQVQRACISANPTKQVWWKS